MTIRIGAAVRLKAHPARRMIVKAIERDWALCRWYDRSAVQEIAFPIIDIELVPAADR
jgi:uncharacterized protein YodC (DUF2158 family)